MISGNPVWDKGVVIGGQALAGSQIASVLETTGGDMLVFYVGDGGVIEIVEWDHGSKWSLGSCLWGEIYGNIND